MRYYFSIGENHMAIAVHSTSVKVIGTNGQISLGKQYAGRQVLVEESEPGVWLVRTATVIPDNEQWLHSSKASTDLANALSWAAINPPSDGALNETLRRISDVEK